ncbi:MAG TPA: hypothetical protein VH969_02505 [Actinophytocola sp.]|uniref:hypothetical protein n=1 Tax=Actinophytocola sp. TaxID=1872138 RepID=UPI002F959436
MVAQVDLVAELKTLRKGRGLLASRIGERIGSALRAICDVSDDDGPALIRQKVARRLEGLAGDLPADLRIAVLAAFAISPDARLPFYQDRVRWTASRLNRDPRTARRRIDAAIDHIAQLATVRPPAPRREPGAAAATGWRTTELRVIVALDRARPEVVELHRIVAGRDGLAWVDLPVPAADVLYGATAVRSGRVALPHALATGGEHEFAIQYRLPDYGVRHVVRTPDQPCDLFDLRVRFDRARPPRGIRLLRAALDIDRDIDRDINGDINGDRDGTARSGETRAVDAAGEVHLVFRDLTPGLAYGVRWTP